MIITTLPWSLRALVFAAIATADSFPYNPTRVLIATNSTIAYVLQPSTQSPNEGVLQTIDIGRSFTTDKFSPNIVTPSLPFLRENVLKPYTPAIDGSGNITVVAGSCTAGAGGTEVWRFSPEASNSSGGGIWTQYESADPQPISGSNLTGSNYLAGAVVFSPEVNNQGSELSFYLFGGMCPFAATDATNWVSDAAYSNTMLQLTPDQAVADQITYNIGSVASRGPAIAEAGFSMTALPPTFAMKSNGQVDSQQQDFLLVGGHTQTAFINMSNIALFSLPQESWSFVPVQQPSGFRTDLAARQEELTVEPRSGHSAVLSDDGTSVIIFGGWVGNVNNPAQPQLAILHLGSEYGGEESLSWTWSIPPTPSGIAPSGDGIYGHGATMLPGGVMMVVGGYSITSSSSDKSKRASQTTNAGIFLYNTTSNSWNDFYAPPSSVSASADSNTGGPLSRTSQRAGLGVGLGIGALVVAGLCCFYLWYSRRLKKQREERVQAMQGESQVSFMQLDQSYMDRPGIDGRGGDMYAVHRSSEMTQAGSTGLWANVPGPTRGLRAGLAKRPYMYHAAPRYDERRLNPGTGNIHPIIESEDEHSIRGEDDQIPESDAVQRLRQVEQAFASNSFEPEQSLREVQRVLQTRASSPIRNPFADPEPNPLGSHPVTLAALESVRRVPTGASTSHSPVRRPMPMEMDAGANWRVVDISDELSDRYSSSNGRSSPSRTDDRTSSTLSEASQRSHRSSTSITRTMSTRTGALLTAALARRKHGDDQENRSPTAASERTNTMETSSSGMVSYHNFDNPYGTTQSLPNQRNSMHGAQKSADSFLTARTSFATLQDQGQALLGGRPMMDRDDPYQRAMAATGSSADPSSSQRDSARPPVVPPRREKGWVGSLRRAITAMSTDRSLSLTSAAAERHGDEVRATSSSPTRARLPYTSTDTPRRAASDGGTLLKQKRGETDWEKDKHLTPYRDDPDPGDWGERRTSLEDRAAENEWDVEGAASKRDVQVMFTVPKARLRVVNADVERASMRSASDSAMSRSDSVRNLRRTESVNTVRSRSDGERAVERRYLHTTVEETEGACTTAREL